MSGRNTKTPPTVSLDRVRAVVARDAPAEYVEVGPRGQRASRHAVYKNATAVLPLGERVPVIIRNLTPKGCRIEYFQNRLLTGRILLIEHSLPLRRWADIAWTDDGVSGLSFVEDSD